MLDTQPDSTSSSRPRLSYLDCLRGLAAVAVMWFHYSLGTQVGPGPASGAVAHFFTVTVDTGKIAVVVFFAISGFIVPESLRADASLPLRRFAISRFFRLYPVYWLSIIACVLTSDGKVEVTTRSFLANLTMIQGFLGVQDINGATWTLAIELVFYMLCALMFMAHRLKSRSWQFGVVVLMLAGSLLLAILRHASGHKYPVALPLALAVMFFGCLWRGYILDEDKLARRYAILSLGFFGALLPVICLVAYADLQEGPRYIWTYFVGLAIFTLYTRYPFYTNRALVHLGIISYSVYVLHTPVWWLVRNVVGFGWIRASSLNGALFVMTAMASTILISHLTYLYVERPSIDAGRRLIRLRLGNTRRVAASVPSEHG